MNKNQASITVETVIVFPIVFFVSCILIYMVLLLYEQATLQALTDEYAQKLAMYSLDKYNDYELTKANSSFTQYGLYWRITGEDNIGKAITDEISAKIDSKTILNMSKEKTKVTVDKESSLLGSKIILTTEKKIDNPLGNVLGLLGIKEDIILKTTSVAKVHEPAEMIRNADLVSDLLFLVKPINKASQRYYRTLDNIKTKIIQFSNER